MVGAVVNAWPAIAFVVASEILLRMLRAAREVSSVGEAAGTVAVQIPTPAGGELDTVADRPVAAPTVAVDGLEDVATGDVPAVPTVAIRAVSRRRTPRRTSSGKPKAHAKIFASEIERAELPSLREVMRRAGVGQSRGREILAELQETIDTQEVTADAA